MCCKVFFAASSEFEQVELTSMAMASIGMEPPMAAHLVYPKSMSVLIIMSMAKTAMSSVTK